MARAHQTTLCVVSCRGRRRFLAGGLLLHDRAAVRGIYRKGAGIGPAITFLFFAPAGNIMALAYTGSILGADFAVARFLLCLLFGIGIGLLMALLFWRDDASHDAQTDTLFADKASISPNAVGVLAITGRSADRWNAQALAVDRNGDRGELAPALGRGLAGYPGSMGAVRRGQGRGRCECAGVAADRPTGADRLTAYKGIENIIEGANRWTWTALGLATTTLLVAALRLTPQAGGLEVAFTGRVFAVGVALWAVATMRGVSTPPTGRAGCGSPGDL